MISTFQALAIAVLAILPGALYTWSFEREDGPWGVGVADRLLRFVGASSVFAVVSLWPLYQGYRYYLVTGDLAAGTPLPPWIWFLPVIYLGIPIAVGTVVGKGSRKQARWVRPITGLANAPRGWDQLFRTPKLKGYMRVRLIDDTTPPTWIVGVFGKSPDNSKLPDSYAAGFPHEQDLYFWNTVDVDQDGEAITNNEGIPTLTGAAALVRWDRVAYAEFIEDPEG